MSQIKTTTELEFFSDEVANKISFFDKGDTIIVQLYAKAPKQNGKSLNKSNVFYKKSSLTQPFDIKVLQSQINSFIKKVIAKDYNVNYYKELTCKIRNHSEDLEWSFTRTGSIPVGKQKTKPEKIRESLAEKQILSNLESHLDKVYEMDLTKYKFSLECLINSTSIFFEENPDIDYISIIRNSLWFGVSSGTRIYFKEKVLFPPYFTNSDVSINRNKEIAFAIYNSEWFTVSNFNQQFKTVDRLITEYEQSQKRNRKCRAYGRQNY